MACSSRVHHLKVLHPLREEHIVRRASITVPPPNMLVCVMPVICMMKRSHVSTCTGIIPDNTMMGTFPDGIRPLTSLQIILDNTLTGTILEGILPLTSLQIIPDHTLTGTILDGIRPITSLQIISDNRLMDTITDGVQSLTYLL